MNKKILSFLILATVLALPLLARAAATVQGIITTASTNLGLAAGGLAIIAFMVAGIMFISATGNPSRIAVAKGSLIAAVVGIVIVILSKTADIFVKNFFGI
jgi:hypothetical protein